mmetsp:Transcript_19444/g.28811  ORF Transcript_19444/g.28811 Transcript_19444/m.28811 type:complete len:126 (+) Transcript_19444:105-482(+)
MSAVDSAKHTASSAWTTIKRAFTNTGKFLAELTLKQALIIAAGTVFVVILFSNLLIGVWQRYLPSMLIGLIRFMLYVMIPMVATGGIIFGMWLERRYEKFDELHEGFMDKLDQLSSGVRSIRKKL